MGAPYLPNLCFKDFKIGQFEPQVWSSFAIQSNNDWQSDECCWGVPIHEELEDSECEGVALIIGRT